MSLSGSSFEALDHVTKGEFSQNWSQINLNIWKKFSRSSSEQYGVVIFSLHHDFS